MVTKELQSSAEIKTLLRNLSQQDFRNFGLQQLAYIRPEFVNNRTVYAIHAADGDRLSVMESFQEAFVAAKMNDLEPVTVQ